MCIFSTIPAHLALIGAKPCGTGGLYLKCYNSMVPPEKSTQNVSRLLSLIFHTIHLHTFYKARLRRNKTGRIKRSITVANHPRNPLQSENPNRAYEVLTSSYHRLLNHLKAHKSNPSTHANPLTLWGGHGDAIDLIMQKARSPNLFESRCRYQRFLQHFQLGFGKYGNDG